MAVDFKFRKNAVSSLTNEIGVYVLADLDNVPIYVGQSKDGIRSRVARHQTSARSDIIANRQIDVWEIAYVWAFPVTDKAEIDELEAVLFNHYDPKSQLMNGALIPCNLAALPPLPKPTDIVQVMSNAEIEDRKQPEQRLPRQASHYAQLVGHFLAVKNSAQIARAMDAHFDRLKKYHYSLFGRADASADEKEM
nr:GIY-YIG nuclease family protein [uncultured Gellertiella sp.]